MKTFVEQMLDLNSGVKRSMREKKEISAHERVHTHHKGISVCSLCASSGKISICVKTHRLSFHKKCGIILFFEKLVKGNLNFC